MCQAVGKKEESLQPDPSSILGITRAVCKQYLTTL
jgi:hypothetical protein